MVWGVVIVYARGLESNALVEYAARRGWEDIHVASDLAMVMRAVRAGKVEVLLASGLRGLGRSLSQLAATVRELAERGVGLCIPSLGIVDAASRQTLLNTLAASSNPGLQSRQNAQRMAWLGQRDEESSLEDRASLMCIAAKWLG